MTRHFRVLRTLELTILVDEDEDEDDWHQGVPSSEGAVNAGVRMTAAITPLDDWVDLGDEVIEVDG